MFTSYKWIKFISKKIKIRDKFISCYFCTVDSDRFVKRARTLEKLKTNGELSPLIYESGKYILFLNNTMVCLDKNDKLAFKNFEDIEKWNKYSSLKGVLLDILTDSLPEVCLLAIDLELEAETDIKQVEVEMDGKFVNVRHSLYYLGQKDSQYILHAKGLINFCKSHNFCCYCGGSLLIKEGGCQKQCNNCKITHYPNLSPTGLTLIEDEKHEKVLLVRQERHPPGMYTCVAGFIEPGESLEESVKREVAEEVGLHVGKVEYCTSQHWAVSSGQLAIGCIATSTHENFDLDLKEIIDAKWVKATDLMDAIVRVRDIKNPCDMNGNELWAPPRNAVSHCLMREWLKKHHKFELTS